MNNFRAQMKKEIKAVEKRYFIEAMKAAKYNGDKTAKILGVSRPTYFRKLKDLGIKFIISVK